MVGGRACSMHRKRLISAPPDFETVTQRRIYTGAYGNLIPLKMAIKVELTLSYKHIFLLSLNKPLIYHVDIPTLYASVLLSAGT